MAHAIAWSTATTSPPNVTPYRVPRAEPVETLTEGDGTGEAKPAREPPDGPVGVHAPELTGAVGGDVEPADGIDRQTVEERGARPGRRLGVLGDVRGVPFRDATFAQRRCTVRSGSMRSMSMCRTGPDAGPGPGSTPRTAKGLDAREVAIAQRSRTIPPIRQPRSAGRCASPGRRCTSIKIGGVERGLPRVGSTPAARSSSRHPSSREERESHTREPYKPPGGAAHNRTGKAPDAGTIRGPSHRTRTVAVRPSR